MQISNLSYALYLHSVLVSPCKETVNFSSENTFLPYSLRLYSNDYLKNWGIPSFHTAI